MTSKEQILSALQNLCVRREYCTSDIRRKALDRCEGDAALADEMVASLKADRFVDDVRYASAFAREKSSLTGWGPVKIRFALRAKGIADSDIAAGLAEIEEDRASSRLASLLQNKWKSLSDDPAGRLKLIRFALSRGYEYSQVEGIVNEITRQ
jgi:regulatory protein